MKINYKHIIFGFILCVISFTAIIEITGLQLFKFRPLGGFSKEYTRPEFKIENWLSGTFQDSMSLFKDNNTLLRTPLIRFYNEYNFRLFKTTRAPEVVIGKNNECFQIDYIREYTGEYFVGEDLIFERCKRLKYLQDTLNKIGIDLIVVFAPGKASYMPENIPDHMKRKIYPENNYRCFIKTCDKLDINVLDLQKHFNSIKDTVSWPLYPTYGIHWSDYGMYLALDTFINSVEKLTKKNIPDLIVSEIETTTIPRDQDNDIARTLNLMFEPKEKTLAYPKFQFSDTTKPEINALFIGDSFLFHWFKYDLGTYLFKKYNFWYYNVMVYPEYEKQKLMNYSLDIGADIKSRDIIVLECTERFLYTAFWNFEEVVYNIFNPEYKPDAMIYHLNDITKDHKRFINAYDAAVNSGQTLKEVIYSVADSLAVKLKPGTVEFYEYSIRQSPEWLEGIKLQAQQQGVPLEEMIHRNAVYMVELENSKKQ
jgi:hypothetical protein